jgi:hypothetical protein
MFSVNTVGHVYKHVTIQIIMAEISYEVGWTLKENNLRTITDIKNC